MCLAASLGHGHARAQNQPPPNAPFVGDSLSVDETLAYLNKQLSTYPDSKCENGNQTTYKLSASADRHSLFVDVAICGDKIWFFRYKVDVFQLRLSDKYETYEHIDNNTWTGQSHPTSNQQVVAYIAGARGTIDCSEVANSTGAAFKKCTTYFDRDYGGSDYISITMTAPPEIGLRVGRALYHLGVTLKSEAEKSIPKDDPFAKPPHS